ncbi:hypothetical protein [Streptomyces griseoaurantiacus]|uniref:hypothetical protein n=1 Tax=Streptomyces griseoaurantiacus TaxID=68213 RepID=UPI00367F143F
MKKSDLVARTMYAFARGNDKPTPVRLLDLRLWRRYNRHTASDPAAWKDVTNERGARPGSSSGFGPSYTTGYLVLSGGSWSRPATAEQIAAVEVPELPEDSTEAAKVIAGLDLPEGITLGILVPAQIREPWAQYAVREAEADARKAEEEAAREQTVREQAAAWQAARSRLQALGVDAKQSRMDRDWAEREPVALLTLAELNKLLDLAEKEN